MKVTDEELIEAIKYCDSRGDVFRKYSLPMNGSSCRRINKLIEINNIDISHFKKNKSHLRIKYPRLEKICPICSNSFITEIGSPKEKTTCSHTCSNTMFRSGENHGNWNPDRPVSSEDYRKLFANDELICQRCGYQEFDCSVQIHHIDENRENNSKENLMPLCANCHQALHKKRWSLTK